MKRFTQLFAELDRTTRTNAKVAALRRYFAAAPSRDAAWALYLLSGNKLMRALPRAKLRAWAAEEARVPLWLVNTCYAAVGDQSETLALLLPARAAAPHALSLADVIEQRLLPLANLPDEAQRDLVTRTWCEFNPTERFLFHKLVSGAFRVGAARKLVARALAQAVDLDPAVVTQRMMGKWQPTAEAYERITAKSALARDPAQPFPFMLAHALEAQLTSLGAPDQWRAEWKWDGIRAQLIRRGPLTLLWSRGEEIITHQFPEVRAASESLPNGTVLDGEIVGWEADRTLPFNALQKRLNRKHADLMLFPECPVAFIAFDLLEHAGADIRALPFDKRRTQLAQLIRAHPSAQLRLSDTIPFDHWEKLAVARASARERGAEGLMLKSAAAPYEAGRVRGVWWKWKVAPDTVDAVLIAAQPGSGRRASLYSDYTFGVWHNDELVPVAKAYSGLSDEEMKQVDAFIRRHTVRTAGPVRFVAPQLVFELAFEGIQESTRHKAGLALRFPRMARRRTDKQPQQADTLAKLRELLQLRSRV